MERNMTTDLCSQKPLRPDLASFTRSKVTGFLLCLCILNSQGAAGEPVDASKAHEMLAGFGDVSGSAQSLKLVFATDPVFAPATATFRSEAKDRMERLAATIAGLPYRSIRVDVFTDSSGRKESNFKFSVDRAAAMREAFLAKGVKADSLTSKGLGDATPIADNKTAEGRSKNRRIEITLDLQNEVKAETPVTATTPAPLAQAPAAAPIPEPQAPPVPAGASLTVNNSQTATITPTGRMSAAAVLYDTTAAKGLNLSTSDVRLGGFLNYQHWHVRIEAEAKGQSRKEGVSGTVDVREAYITRSSEFGQFTLGRLLPASVLIDGRYLRINPIDDSMGSANSLRYATRFSGFDIQATLGNTLGSTPVSTLRTLDTDLDTLYNHSLVGERKDGSAASLRLETEIEGVTLGLWFGYEKNRFAIGPEITELAQNGDGVMFQRYSEGQLRAAYAWDAFRFHLGVRHSSRSESIRKIALLPNGKVIENDTASYRDTQRTTTVILGSEYRMPGVEGQQLVTGVDLISTGTATDNTTRADESIEDENDTLLLALSQAWIEGPFEVSLNVHQAMAKGESYPDEKGSIGANKNRTLVFVHATFDLSAK
jgi:outer membrane protein OmpA-like peptidoglycan-associated protein